MTRTAVFLIAASLLLSLVACTTDPLGGAGAEETEAAPAPSTPGALPATTSSTSERPAVRLPASCSELVSAELEASLIGSGMTFRPTDDTIQGRFSGIGNSEEFVRCLSCAYDYPSGVEGTRFEFGVEALTPSEREALLTVLRSGAGANTTGLTEEQVGDRFRFTQLGAAVLETVPDDWTMTFVVFPDAWTMVWSPSGGAELLTTQRSYSETLERQLYAAR